MSPRGATPTVKVIEKSLDILACFNVTKHTWGLSELATEVGLHKSTAYRILLTLMSRGFIKQDQETRKFSLGIKLFELGAIVFNTLDIVAISRPVLQELADQGKETVFLAVVDGYHAVCIDQIESPHELRMVFNIGRRMLLHAGASNKVLLAYMDEATVEQFILSTGLPRLCVNTICDRENLKRELAAIRKKGYAYSEEETNRGIYGVAAPIFNHKGNVVASIGMAAPVTRLKKSELHLLENTFKQAARKISHELAWRCPPRHRGENSIG